MRESDALAESMPEGTTVPDAQAGWQQAPGEAHRGRLLAPQLQAVLLKPEASDIRSHLSRLPTYGGGGLARPRHCTVVSTLEVMPLPAQCGPDTCFYKITEQSIMNHEVTVDVTAYRSRVSIVG